MLNESDEIEHNQNEISISKKEYETKLGIHSAQNLLGGDYQVSLFEEKKSEIEKKFGQLDGSIDRFGASMSDVESRVMEGILKGFTKTNYKGNMPPTELTEGIGTLGVASSPLFKDFKAPRLRVTQSELMRWCNMPKNSIGAKERVVSALRFLTQTPFCFYYDRLAFDNSGKPLKLPNGRWKKEPVTVVSTLFTIKGIDHETTDKLHYYEITPSAIFLDQRENYFIMLRNNWRQEVEQLVGKRKVSKYTFLFLLFLSCQYELKRRNSHQSKPYEIRWKPEDVAGAIKMPASVIKKNKKRMNKILDDVYSVAQQLGYLKGFERLDFADVLSLNEESYYNPGRNIVSTAVKTISGSQSAPTVKEQYIFDIFHKTKQEVDEKHIEPQGSAREGDFRIIRELLKVRPAPDVEQLIKWGLKKSYWCTQINTALKLMKNFDNAWLEMKNSRKISPSKENKNWSITLKARFDLLGFSRKMRFEVNNNDVELGHIGHPNLSCIPFKDKDFKKRVDEYFSKSSESLSLNYKELMDF